MLPERDDVLRHPSLLGHDLCPEDGRLFYFDPARNLRLLTPAEQRTATQKAEEAKQLAQAERDRESAARQAAEARIAELERKLGGK